MRNVLLIIFSLACGYAPAQSPHFRKVTTADGLNDGAIESFGQDKYGYIWIGTPSGLNRFDGYQVKQFMHRPGDSTSILPGHVWAITSGPDSNMYFILDGGLARYNYAQNNFTLLKAPRAFGAGKMISRGKELLFAASIGLVVYNPYEGSWRVFSEKLRDTAQFRLAQKGLVDMELLADGRILATSRIGLLLIDPDKNKVTHITIPGLPSQLLNEVEVMTTGEVWLSMQLQPKLVKTDLSFRRFQTFDYLFPNRKVVNNAISELLVDREDNLWVTTVPDGLCLFNKNNNSFTRYINDPFQPNSLTANHLTAIFQDRNGLIWTGTGGGYGVHYFNPDKQLFQTILPKGNATTAGGWMWGRAAAEDKHGKLWLATLDGIAQYDLSKGLVRNFKNEENRRPQLFSNSVRGVMCEDDRVWICTAEGVNCYRLSTGKMEFLNTRDSLPPAFYFSAFKDSRGTIWIGSRDNDGLYYKEQGKEFRSIRHHPVLKKISGFGIRVIFEDGYNRLWFGGDGTGLAVYDSRLQRFQHWKYIAGDSNSLAGNLVTGIAESNKGLIWVSTNNGISCVDTHTNTIRSFNTASGLPVNRTSSIKVDLQDRVWAGSARGLLMLDPTRAAWRTFDESDGLPTLQFTDMPSFQLKDGRYLFPSLKGFVLFDPASYKPKETSIPVYIASFSVFKNAARGQVNFEAAKNIRLRYDENFFSIGLIAFNYENPSQTWYAYKLEGFDKDWIYTRERVINYTNVPGGTYRFLYKASNVSNKWKAAEKLLVISIGKVFYKTVWFWLLVGTLLVATLYSLYRFRMNKQRLILQLETRARELEKEKTVVQYESLKQHLNPHFLFNSLTSLRSLIKTDTRTATGFLDGLSKVYRYVLRSGDKELSLLAEEIEFVKTFVLLQKTRFGEGLDVSIDVGPAATGKLIVPVTLQNLVENAIKHNTASSDSPLGISIYLEANYIVVRNNLQRYRMVETSNRQGLKNLSKLYRFYSSTPLVIEENEQFFTVKIPLL